MTKLLSYDDLAALGIRYSRPHLWRMYTSGKFPKPLKLSASRNAWTESDITTWIENRVAERDGRPVEAA
jgi:predicted DNA-binding transcriptional regulator AlpA